MFSSVFHPTKFESIVPLMSKRRLIFLFFFFLIVVKKNHWSRVFSVAYWSNRINWKMWYINPTSLNSITNSIITDQELCKTISVEVFHLIHPCDLDSRSRSFNEFTTKSPVISIIIQTLNKTGLQMSKCMPTLNFFDALSKATITFLDCWNPTL